MYFPYEHRLKIKESEKRLPLIKIRQLIKESQ